MKSSLKTASPDLLLPTILSRTQEVVVPRLTDEEVRAELERRGERDPEKIRTFTRLAAGDLIELEHLLRGEGDELRKDDFEFFCSLMRLSYNDKHLELMAWAEEVAQLSRKSLPTMSPKRSRKKAIPRNMNIDTST